jgi:hypothetical protein
MKANAGFKFNASNAPAIAMAGALLLVIYGLASKDSNAYIWAFIFLGAAILLQKHYNENRRW